MYFRVSMEVKKSELGAPPSTASTAFTLPYIQPYKRPKVSLYSFILKTLDIIRKRYIDFTLQVVPYSVSIDWRFRNCEWQSGSQN